MRNPLDSTSLCHRLGAPPNSTDWRDSDSIRTARELTPRHVVVGEVVDEFGGSTTWDDLFATEQDALKEVLACIAKEGMASFVVDDADDEEPKTLH